jgi:CubicO group peptidase (beta-lactamase class C family)
MRTSCALIAVLSATVLLRAADGIPALPRSAPEAQGVSSTAILDFVDAAEKQIDALHSLMIVRHGNVIAEGWWAPYAADEPHMLYSLSKSFTSTAVGLAVAEGRLTVDDLVLGFFPEDAPADPSANLRAMRVRDLLTMSTGQHDEDIRDFRYYANANLVQRFLAIPVTHKPGTLFVYNTPASYMLSAIVQKVTGQTVLDYLRPRLFEPLGITNPDWENSAQGVSMGGFGLSLKTEHIARFGQLYLQKGQWQGRQLIPAEWVETATSRQMSNGSSPMSDWEQGYGYQFWRARHGFYRGDGAFGQFCLILPQYDTVIAITSGTRDMGSVMNLVWDRIVPALGANPLPADGEAHRKLTSRLASLTLPAQTSTVRSQLGASLGGKRFVFGHNPDSMESLTVNSIDPGGEATLTVRTAGADQRVMAAPGVWQKGTLKMPGQAIPVAISGGWTSANTYTLKTVRYRTPYVTTYMLRFTGNQLIVESEQNVSFTERTTQWVGRSVEAPTQGKK